MGNGEIVGGNQTDDRVVNEIKEDSDDCLLCKERVDMIHVDVQDIVVGGLGNGGANEGENGS